jgi:hypothetical protein
MSNIVEKAGCTDQPADRACDVNACTGQRDSRDPRDCDRACVSGNRRSRHRRDNSEAASKGKQTRAREMKWGNMMSLASMAAEYVWLWDVRHGISTREIAIREGLTHRRVQYGVARAEALERSCSTDEAIRIPKLIPLFPLGHFTPQSACRHHGPIEPGSIFCCVVCHCSGIDDHPGLRRDPVTDPAPEPKPAPAPKRKTARETRKQRRQRIFVNHP